MTKGDFYLLAVQIRLLTRCIKILDVASFLHCLQIIFCLKSPSPTLKRHMDLPSWPICRLQVHVNVNFVALRKYNFLDFFGFTYKIFAVTILNIIPLTERTFQSRMLTFLRKSSSVSSFLLPASGLHSVQSFFYCSLY